MPTLSSLAQPTTLNVPGNNATPGQTQGYYTVTDALGRQIPVKPGQTPQEALQQMYGYLGYDPSGGPNDQTNLTPQWAPLYQDAGLKEAANQGAMVTDPNTGQPISVDQYYANLPQYQQQRQNPYPTGAAPNGQPNVNTFDAGSSLAQPVPVGGTTSSGSVDPATGLPYSWRGDTQSGIVGPQGIPGNPQIQSFDSGAGVNADQLANPTAVLPIVGAIGSGIIGANATDAATQALQQGGQQAIQTVQQGGTAAQQTLQNNLAKQEQTLNPFVTQGQGAANTLATGAAPGGDLVKPFSWTPADLVNDPAYQFRLKQGQDAINQAANAAGTRFSGATLKDLADYNTGSAAQAEQQDYARQFGTYQYNQQTQLQALQAEEQMGLQATGQQVNAGNTTAQSTANIQTSTALAVSNIQTQIATAIAQGDYNRANSLQSALQSLLNGIQNIPGLGGAPGGGTTAPGAGGITVPTTSPNGGIDSTVPTETNSEGETVPAGSSGGQTIPSGQIASGAGTAGATGASLANIGAAAPGSPLADTGVLNPGDLAPTGPVPADLSTIGAAAPGSPLAGTGVLSAGDLAPGAAPIDAASEAAAAAVPGAELGADLAGSSAISAALPGAEFADAGVAAPSIGGSGLLSSVASFLTNPWTIGIGAAILGGAAIIKALQVHPVADEWVHGAQNKFDTNSDQAFRGFVSNVTSGQMTQAQAITAYRAMQSNFTGYENALQSFSQKGSKQAIVARQAQDTFNQYYGAGGQNVLGAMAAYIQQYYGDAAWSQATGQGALATPAPASSGGAPTNYMALIGGYH